MRAILKSGLRIGLRGGLRSGLLSVTPLLILGLMPHTARAATINVPASQPTIQAAINAASNGDTVLVAPGTYYENINFMGKAITVTSSGGPSVTTINGNAAGPVVTFNTAEGRSSVLSGFTITNGNTSSGIPNHDGGGIYVNSASPTITNNLITANVACGGGGAGIAALGSAPLIQGNIITNNNSGGCSGIGGGIYIHGYPSVGSAQIIGNTISNNFMTGDGGGIALFGGGTPTVEGNVISGNTAWGESNGGGISINGDALIVQNLIYGNYAGQLGNNTGGQGGGIYFMVLSGFRGPYIINNTIMNNQATQGSGVFAIGYDSQVEMFNNLVIASPGQPAFYCDTNWGQTPQTIQNNDAFSSGGNGFDGGCAGTAGTNSNISADPLFIHPASNFRVQTGSPAIDAGDNSAPNLPSTDLDGNPRIVDGNNDGTATVDMGAYEFIPTTDTLSPASLTFGNQAPGTTSPAQTVTLTNTGGQKLLFSVSIDSGLTNDNLQFAETDDCGSAVAPGAACSINVTFSPRWSAGTFNANLTIRSNAQGSPQAVALSGTANAPVASLSRLSLTFGSENVGTTSAAQAVTLTNTGNAPLSISSVAIGGSNSGDFSANYTITSSPCPITPSTLPAGASCIISVTFAPRVAGSRYGILTVTDNAPNSPQMIGLTGTATSGPATLSPASLTFPSQIVGATSAPQPVTLTNSGTAPMSFWGMVVSGDFAANYATTTAPCPVSPSTLAAGQSCIINVTFTPTATGTRTGTLSVQDTAANSPQTISLTGTGVNPPPPPAPSIVQVQNNIATSGAAFTTFSVNIATKAGDLLVAFCRESSNGTDNFTVTDSAGQIWTRTASGYRNESSTGPRSGMFYVANSAAVTSVTVKYPTSGGVIKPGIMVMEISGAASSLVADGSVNNGTASTTTSTSGSLTTTNANDILIFATETSGNENGWTAGAGYTIPNNGVTTGNSGSNVRMAMQYQAVASPQTNASTAMTYAKSNWNGNIFAAFKGGSSSVSVTVSALSFSPTTVTGGSSSTGTVTLSGAAPSGGAAVSLSINNTAAQIPASVTVAAGATSATFTATTPSVTSQVVATVMASCNSTSQTATLTVNPGATTGSGPAFVQVQNNIDVSGAAFTSFSVPITTAPGDLLVAFVRESSNGTDNFTVTDSAGQTWTQTSSGYRNESSTGPRSGMFYVANSAGVTSVTVKYTTSAGVIKPGIIVMEISGAAVSGVADGSVNNGTASTTTSTSGALTTTNASDILIFAAETSSNETGWTAGAGYAIPNNKLMIGASGSNVRMAMQYAVVTSTQTNATTSMTYANSNWNGNIFAAFK